MRTQQTILEQLRNGRFELLPNDIYTIIMHSGTISDTITINLTNSNNNENIDFAVGNTEASWNWLKNLADVRPVYYSIDGNIIPFWKSEAYQYRFGTASSFMQSITE